MGDDAAILQAILAHPVEDGPRLVYADWLDERGDPRGEFIRIQCELATLAPGDARRKDLARRERQLLQQHAAGWSAPLAGIAEDYGFRRGFLAWANIMGDRIGELRDPPPLLTDITVLDWLAGTSDVAEGLLGRQVERLTLAFHQSSGELTAFTLAELARRTPYAGLRALSDSTPSSLPCLFALTLARLEIDPAALSVLVNAPFFPQLEELDLSGQPLPASFVQSLAGHERVRRVNLSGCGLSPEECAPLADPRQEWRPLALDLRDNELGGTTRTERFLDNLTADRSPLVEVERLDLSANGFTSREQRRLRQHFGARVIL